MAKTAKWANKAKQAKKVKLASQVKPAKKAKSAKSAKWTVMVFMGANNIAGKEKDLTKEAEDDLREMESVGSQKGILNIVVQIDQKVVHNGEKIDRGPQRLFIAKNKRQDVGPIPEGQGGSGSPRVLESFIRWAKKRYRAERYLLVLWGHAYHLAFNRDPNDPEGLDFPKLSKVLRKTNASGKKLDIVAFDSCNTGLIEGAYQLRETAAYLVASQFSDPLPGWPYDTILDRLLNDRNYQNKHSYFAGKDGTKDFGRAIVSQFVRNYRGDKSATMTMLDLAQAERVGGRLEELADQLTLAVHDDAEERARILDIFQRCQVPSLTAEGQPSVDLMSLCWNLTNFSADAEVQLAAAAVGEALLVPSKAAASAGDGGSPFIVAHAGSDLVVVMLQGVSVFAPNVVTEGASDLRALRETYDLMAFAKDTRWGNLVFALAETE